jgi:hypothetical protein
MACPDLQLVADAYTAAAANGPAPILALGNFGISMSTDSRWVA